MATEPRETSGATTALLLRHVRARGGADAVREVVARAGVQHLGGRLEDRTCWVSHATRVRLFEAATSVLDDPRTMFDVGAAALRNGLDHRRLLLRAYTTPREVFRHLPHAVPTFTSAAVMQVLECQATSATIQCRLLDGHLASRLECEYSQGIISAVPEAFGLPAAMVRHDQCQADGFPACVYRVEWARHRRFSRADGIVTSAEPDVVELRAQIDELQLAASDLVDSDDVDGVLDRIIARAASALLAPAYVLAVHSRDGGPPRVRSRGLDVDDASRLARTILDTDGDGLGPRAVVVDVVSRRYAHGRLAALWPSDHAEADQDRPLLDAYARHAAAALDVMTALEDSQREASRATALLRLAHALAGVRDTASVAGVVADAIPGIVGCRTVAVLLWDPGTGALTTVVESGHAPAERSALLVATSGPDVMAELGQLITRREPALVVAATTSPAVARTLVETGDECAIVLPLLAGDALIGVVIAGWPRAISGSTVLVEAVTRLEGVGDLAATALENARLLVTVRHQSLHDALTGLPNRVLFARSLDVALRVTEPDAAVAVLFCDLDRFKHINDKHGHAAGDELLRQVAVRLRDRVRPADIVGRLSGDEFAVILPAIGGADQAETVAHRIVEALDEPFRIDGHELRVTSSIGVAVHVGLGGRGETLLAAADTAMYVAKQHGRNRVSVAGGSRPHRRGGSLAAELAGAVAAGQLRLYFQPVLDLTDPTERGMAERGRVVGAEALVRWAHPRLGLLSPATFLPLAEETGLITELDLWSLRTACTALATWGPGGRGPVHVVVNLAGATLADARLVATVQAALTEHAIAPGRLRLEVVESHALVEVPATVARLAELRSLGVKISLDHVGAGDSTLTLLQALPVDQITIDRTFIEPLPHDRASRAVVRALVSMAHELGIDVVAAGIEEPEQLAAVQDVGCDLGQGYLLGRPGPAAPTGHAPAAAR